LYHQGTTVAIFLNSGDRGELHIDTISQVWLQLWYIENIQVIKRNGFSADTTWTSETYIGKARFVKSL